MKITVVNEIETPGSRPTRAVSIKNPVLRVPNNENVHQMVGLAVAENGAYRVKTLPEECRSKEILIDWISPEWTKSWRPDRAHWEPRKRRWQHSLQRPCLF